MGQHSRLKVDCFDIIFITDPYCNSSGIRYTMTTRFLFDVCVVSTCIYGRLNYACSFYTERCVQCFQSVLCIALSGGT